jgi:hypothetical protein
MLRIRIAGLKNASFIIKNWSVGKHAAKIAVEHSTIAQ